MNGNSQNSASDDQPVEEFVKDVMSYVKGCQKLSTELAGWHHYRDYTGVERTMEQVNGLLTTLVSNIFKHQGIKILLSRHKLLDQFDMLREGNDALLERINSDIDEASGLKKNADAELLAPSVLREVQGPTRTAFGKNMVLLASRNVQKPQLFFTQKVDNSHKRPFIPFIEEKPNSLKPLSILLCLDDNANEYYNHPYEYELHHWNPRLAQLRPVIPKLPTPMTETPIVMVRTVDELYKVVAELKQCQEFALDLEHHSYRSYQGLTCLMQISTREMDYIIDPLSLRGQLTILNEVFTDPKITKVAHGADHDVLWLQRDCGIYIVNLFDTHQASRVLEYPHRSLAALLTKFCQIEANKVYQRADWRIRPLPEDFIDYARQDSHYLLFIYDLMRNELIEKGNKLNNLILAVYNRSTEICLKRYEKPIVGPESHMDIYRRSRKAFHSRQLFALQALYLWRDRVAREQDESPEYVLPKHMLLQIAEVLPKEMQGVLACCNPIPPLIKTELLTLHTLIREARQQPLLDIKPSIHEQQLPLRSNQSSDDHSTDLISKHDLSQCEENPSELPVLLKPGENLLGDLFMQYRVNVSLNEKSQMFNCHKSTLEYRIRGLLEISTQFMSPFDRYTNYLEMKPFLEGEKNKKEGVDQDRVKRIMEHFITLTNNTRNDVEYDENTGRDSPMITDVMSRRREPLDRQSYGDLLGLEHQVEGNSVRQITHQAIDSFLDSARRNTSEGASFLESARRNTTESAGNAHRVDSLLSHFRTVSGNITAGSSVDDASQNSDEEDMSSDSNDDIPEEKKAKRTDKKEKKTSRKMVLSDEVKSKKTRKNKSTKRQSTDNTNDDSPPKKVKVEEVSAQDTEEKEEGEISDSQSENEDETFAFNYETADYSIFQKARQKSYYNKPIKEKFKGKRQKKPDGRTSVKDFSFP